MECLNTVVIAILNAVLVVDWRRAQWCTYHLAIIEPAWVFTMVVVVVLAADLVGEGAVLVVVDWATLVL